MSAACTTTQHACLLHYKQLQPLLFWVTYLAHQLASINSPSASTVAACGSHHWKCTFLAPWHKIHINSTSCSHVLSVLPHLCWGNALEMSIQFLFAGKTLPQSCWQNGYACSKESWAFSQRAAGKVTWWRPLVLDIVPNLHFSWNFDGTNTHKLFKMFMQW